MIGQKVAIPAGWGYWDVTSYPVGGDFHRATEPIELTIEREFAPGSDTHWTNFVGVTSDGRKIAFDMRKCAQVVGYDAIHVCVQCSTPMNPVEWVMGATCGACCRKNQERVTGARPRSKRKGMR